MGKCTGTITLKHITSLMAGHPFRGSIENTPGGAVAVVQMRDVDPKKGIDHSNLIRVNVTGRKQPDYLKRGDILFMGRGYRLFAVLVDQDLEHTVAGSHFFILRIKPNKHAVSADYLTWYINHNRAQKYFSRHVAGTALPHVNRRTLEHLPVVLPPLAVQAQIMQAYRCSMKEKALLAALIQKKTQFLDKVLDQTLAHYIEKENA
ncbi:restriction endonuclease subunit S [Nitrosomonas aestuarii]|uniref:restriction endonuclease subunit S n=1 Tax=Nitrosomonas aestuarii TaxID=52441 RepID=UPI000D309B93|nr:restriction endonuclease subunit S [Nitrosomonas aestuarii]PTN09686.1 type I restriction modification DNA specificity protein [Nitrosomonas aestuarii]